MAKSCRKVGPLTTRKRDNLVASDFGLPSERKFPMPDARHASSAKGRAKTSLKKGNITKTQYAKIVKRADRVLARCSVKGLGQTRSQLRSEKQAPCWNYGCAEESQVSTAGFIGAAVGAAGAFILVRIFSKPAA